MPIAKQMVNIAPPSQLTFDKNNWARWEVCKTANNKSELKRDGKLR